MSQCLRCGSQNTETHKSITRCAKCKVMVYPFAKEDIIEANAHIMTTGEIGLWLIEKGVRNG